MKRKRAQAAFGRLWARRKLGFAGLVLLGLGWADEVLSAVQNVQFAWEHRAWAEGMWDVLGDGSVRTLLTIGGLLLLAFAALLPQPRAGQHGELLPPRQNSRLPLIQHESEGHLWRWKGRHNASTGKPVIGPVCRVHDVFFSFRDNRTGKVSDLSNHHYISTHQAPWERDGNGSLFCGGDGGHSEHFDTDDRSYQQAVAVATPLLAAKLVRWGRENR